MLPFIQRCKAKNIPILVMNPNYKQDPISKAELPFSGDMVTHAKYVWLYYIKNSGFTDISIVAHSAGGACLSGI
jgi:hypothetical protein